MYDERLIRKINRGRAFALIGSGPSSEVGYPSWKSLAEKVTKELEKLGRQSDPRSYAKYLEQRKYPELFSQAERDLGSRGQLIDLMNGFLEPTSRKAGIIYDILTGWPFACYLTTNWDDEIERHLQAKKTYYSVLGNSKEDLANIRSDASGFIVKLHSDLKHPDSAVITSADYAKLLGSEGRGLRDRLKSIFEMFDVLIVGHSLADPDLSLMLQIAKESAHPEHPVFLLAADLTSAEIQEYWERYNIVAQTYENPDGGHLQLRRLLSLFDKFIIPRQKRLDLKASDYSAEELEAAQSVAIYRRLVTSKADEGGTLNPFSYLGPLVLRALHAGNVARTLDELTRISPLSVATTTEAVRNHVPAVLEALQADALVERVGEAYKLTEKGSERTKELCQVHAADEKQAFGQFTVGLKSRCSSITSAEQSRLVQILQDTLVRVFKQRGLSFANAIFGGQSMNHSALSDVFAAISNAAATISPADRAVALWKPHRNSFLARRRLSVDTWLRFLKGSSFITFSALTRVAPRYGGTSLRTQSGGAIQVL